VQGVTHPDSTPVTASPRAHRRRRVLALLGASLLAPSGPARAEAEDVSGSLPRLAFRMQRAGDGATVTAADFRGSVVLLYFGYTWCPDVCPTTLANLAAVLNRLDATTVPVRVLFVTVDPARDNLAALRRFTAAFGTDFVGLRPSPDMLAAVARRYRVAYSVQPQTAGKPYTVSHGAGVYVFDRAGAARVILTGLDQPHPDLAGAAATVRQAAAAPPGRGALARLLDR
jgi:protein SCO1/2